MGVRFVMIELCRTVLTRCNLEEGRSDVEEWDLEERDLTKLVERSVSREDTSVIEVSSVVCCRTIWLTTDLSWKWKRYISSSKSYRAARRCAGFNAHFDHVKIARRRLFFGFIREGDTPSTASPSRMHHRWLALSCRCQELDPFGVPFFYSPPTATVFPMPQGAPPLLWPPGLSISVQQWVWFGGEPSLCSSFVSGGVGCGHWSLIAPPLWSAAADYYFHQRRHLFYYH